MGTFVYSVLVLGSIPALPGGTFVPHLSITVAEALLLVDLAVLIYFIHHIASSIQLPEVIAGIARDLDRAIEAEFPEHHDGGVDDADPSSAVTADLIESIQTRGAVVTAKQSGYLQFVGYGQLIEIAETLDAVIRLAHRPGHFIVANRPLATVWPAGAAGQVAAALDKAHVTGPHRTLTQDPVFAIDQLVEIAIRALSAAVNDTFTALTCIDWLSAGLSEISSRVLDEGVYRGRSGKVRLIEFDPSYDRMVNRAFDKVRQAARGMPAVIIRMIDALAHIAENTTSDGSGRCCLRQAEMILRGAEREVPEPNDLADIRVRFDRFVRVHDRVRRGIGQGRSGRGSMTVHGRRWTLCWPPHRPDRRSPSRGRALRTRRATMAIAVGDKIPDIRVMTSGPDGPTHVQTGDVLGSGKVVLFAVPGRVHPDLLGLPPAQLRHPPRRAEGQGGRHGGLHLGQRPLRHGCLGRGPARGRPGADAGRRQRRVHQGRRAGDGRQRLRTGNPVAALRHGHRGRRGHRPQRRARPGPDRECRRRHPRSAL